MQQTVASTYQRQRRAELLLLIATLLVLVALIMVLGPKWTLAFLVAGAVAAVAAARPDVAVLGLIAWLPFETTLLKYVPASSPALALPDFCSAILLVSFGARIALSRDHESWRSARLLYWTGGLLAIAALLAWMRWQTPAIDAAYWCRTWLRFLPLGFVAAVDPWRTRILRRLPSVLIPVVGLQVLAASAEYVGGQAMAERLWPGTFSLGGVTTSRDTLEAATIAERYVAGTLGHYNILALFLVLSLGVFLAASRPSGLRAMAIPDSWRPVLSAAMFAATIGIILSASRQGVLSLILVAVGAAVITRGQMRLSRTGTGFLVAALVVLLAVSGTITFWQTASQRFAALTTERFWDVFQHNRGYGISLALDALWESRFVGLGPGSFGLSYAGTTGIPQAVSVLQVDPTFSYYITDVGWASLAAQVGLIGVLGLVLVIVALAAALPRRLSGEHEQVMAWTLIVFLTAGMMASTPLTYKPTSVLFWVMLGLLSPRLLGARQRGSGQAASSRIGGES